VDKPNKKKHYYALYKPQNVMTTMEDPAKRPCIGDLVNTMDVHAFPVGRLDFDTEGLLLLTNDGQASHAMLHPKFHVEKTYRVKIKGQPDQDTIDKLRKGVKLEDGFAKPTFLKVEKTLKENTWVIMKLTEGRNHIVKRMWQRMGHPVLKLIRTGFGPVELGNLKVAQIRKLTASEIKAIEKITAKTKS
jgi:23S rRNA pseudouridine2605 synthase